jgi:hypothetical protein
MRFPLPGFRNRPSPRYPPLGKVGDLADGGVELEYTAKAHEHAVFGIVRCATGDLPVSIVIVCNVQDREPMLENMNSGKYKSVDRL